MKYLFGVQFQDNKTIQQTDDDKSLIDPSRSCYYDILQEENRGNFPIKFCLTGNNSYYLLDLYDGSFEVGANSEETGGKFYLYEPQEGGLKLIYYRNVSISFTSAGTEECKTTTFNFGWQIPGTDVKKIITLR